MATVTIPLRSDLPDYDLGVTLDGEDFVLAFKWHERSSSWFMSIADGEGDLIVGGLRCVVDFPIGRRCADPRRPPGVLLFVDTSGDRLDPGEEDLGARVVLIYAEAGDFPLPDLTEE